MGKAVPHGLGVDQAQGPLVAGLAEQALARADRNREDGQAQLVDQVVLHQRAHERAAGVHDDLPLYLLLELRDLANYLARQDGRVRPFGLLERRGHDVLGQAVQTVQPLVAPPTHQQRLGALCLGQFELRPRLPVLAHELNKPAAVPEPSLAARVLDDAVKRDVLADHDLSHLDSPWIRGAPRTGTASIRVDASRSANWACKHRPIRGAGGVGTFRRAESARREEEKRGCMQTSDLIARASAGDHNAFRELVEVHSHELQVHCYRILGSLQDAEDALQETLVSAWRNLGNFGQRSSLRTWLYKIATNRCLDMLRADSRRPRIAPPLPEATLPAPTGPGDAPPRLEPYPDVLLDHLVDQRPGPETRYETTEAISLAFITALQLLPPRQRAVLVLRDVLGYRAAEVARMLDATQESVQSALKRARATVDSHLADSGSTGSGSSGTGSSGGTGSRRPARQPDTAAEHRLV